MQVICNSYFRDEMFKRTHKKVYNVNWMIAKPGTEVFNKLENCSYVTDFNNCVVIKGTQGELWVTTLEKFGATYEFSGRADDAAVAAHRVGYATPWFKAKSRPGKLMWAVRIPDMSRIEIVTAYGTVMHANAPYIHHGHGDFVVCANDDSSPQGYPMRSDMWVVNGAVFEDTYDMSNFR